MQTGEDALAGVSARIRVIAVFEFWWEELERILYSDNERAIICIHVLARILDDCFMAEEQQNESEERVGHFSLLTKLVAVVMQDFAEVAENAFQLTSSISNPAYARAILRLMVALKQACWMSGDDFYLAFPHEAVEQFLEEHARSDFADPVFAARYAFLAGEFVEDTNADLPFNPASLIQTAISKFQAAKGALESRNHEVASWLPNQRTKAAFVLNCEVPVPLPNAPPNAPVQAAQWCQDEEQVEGSTDQLLMFTAGNLRFLAATADYSEALPFAIEADLVSSCLELLDCPYFPLQLFALSWFVNALTHKKIAVELVEKMGMHKIMSFTRSMQSIKNFYTILAPYTTFILVALSKHSQPMEALLREYSFAKELLLFGCEFMGENSMDGKLNIVEWFGEIFGHPIMLQLSQEIGVIPLIAWELKRVLDMDADDKMGPIKPAFIKEAVRSLLKYININLYWAVQYSKGSVSELASHSIASNGNAYLSCSIVRVDEQQMNSLELFVLKHLSLNNQFPPGMKLDLLAKFKEQLGGEEEPEMVDTFHQKLAGHFTRKSYEDDTVSVVSQVRNVSPEWSVAKAYLDYDIIPLLLMLLNMEGKDSNLHALSLQALQLLCLDSACTFEIQHCIPYSVIPNRQETLNDTENLSMKKGLEILLHIVNPNVRRDPLIITSTLKVLCAMCTPPQYRYNGSSAVEAEKLLIEFQKRQAELLGAQGAVAPSARKRLSFDTTKKPVFVRETQQSKLETAQSAARIGVRTYAGISSLVQLLYFRRHQNYAFSVRLETVKILIGIAHDKEICQILSKMRVNTIISNQLQPSGEGAWFDNGQSVNKAEKDLLVFYSSILSDAIFTNIPISERNIDATQEALTRKSIVEKSHIDFDEDELMDLIKEHLFSKGMFDTVAALQIEQSQIKAGGSKIEVCQPANKLAASAFTAAMKSPMPSSMPAPSSNGSTLSKKRPRSTSPEPTEPEDPSSSRKIMRRLSHELQTPGWQESMSFTRNASFAAPETGNLPSATYSTNFVTIAWSQRRKNMKKAMTDASYADVASASSPRSTVSGIMASPQPAKTPAVVQSVRKQESNKASKLSAIMTRYLKLQHSQCKHPVATLPLMSICKPHVCPRPKNMTRMNISSITQTAFSLGNSTWYNYPRFMENFQRLRYVYSSYKPLRTFRYVDNECGITGVAFSKDSTKLWVAHLPTWDGSGPGLAHTNYLSGVQETTSPAELQDLGGSITQITLSPLASPNPLIMLSVTSDNVMRGAEHSVMLWKDLGTVETFDARRSHNIQVQTPNDPANTDARPLDLFWEECFSNTGSHLGVVYSLDRSDVGRADPYGAAVIDLQSGATVYNIVDQDNMQSYDRPQISFVGDDDRLLVFDGKLWDIRISQCVHRFDKLSSSGMTAVHPFKPEILIDSSVWDLRTFNLSQTIPILDGCKMSFNTVHSVLFAHKAPNFQEFQPNTENNFFHVLDASYYQHLHTEMIDKENMELWDVHVDRHGLGYMATLGGSNQDSLCRVMEIGKRRVVGDGDSGDEDDDEDDEMDEGDEEWFNGGYGGRGPDDDDDSTNSDNDFDDEDSDADDDDDAGDESENDDQDDEDDEDDVDEDYEEGAGDDDDSDFGSASQPEGSRRHRDGDDEEGWETVSEEGEEED